MTRSLSVALISPPRPLTATTPRLLQLPIYSGHQFRFLDRLANRLDRLFDVDNHAAPQPFRWAAPHADDLQHSLSIPLGDDGGDLGRTQIQTDYDISPTGLFVSHQELRSLLPTTTCPAKRMSI